MRIGRKSKDVDDDAAMAMSDLPQTPEPAPAPPVDDCNLVLCDANGVERTRIADFQGFRVTHEGVIYEHCATDEAGRWIYRPM